jgi:hypothetical protein
MQGGYILKIVEIHLRLTKLSNFVKYININHSSQIHFAENVRTMSRQVLYNRQETTIRGDFKQSNFYFKSHVCQRFIKMKISLKKNRFQVIQ